jgi:hypothetical protein
MASSASRTTCGFGAALVPASAMGTTNGVRALRLGDADARHPIGLVHQRPHLSAPSARVILELMLRTSAGQD